MQGVFSQYMTFSPSLRQSRTPAFNIRARCRDGTYNCGVDYYRKNGEKVHVNFQGDPGGRWNKEDLYLVIEQNIKQAER